MKKHLLVDISAHGFGHLAQTAAVLNALDYTNLRITIRSLAPEAILRERILIPFDLIHYQQDNGMVMYDALRVDAEATMRWHYDFHQHYSQHLLQAQADLQALSPDLLLANVPYLSLAAANLLGIPTLVLCSLNWADLFQHYCGQYKGAETIHTQMLQAYQSVQCFLQPTPSMPMTTLPNTQVIAPIALRGQRQSTALKQHLGLRESAQLILVSLGGIGMLYPLAQWPQLQEVYWIFPDQALTQTRADFIAQSQITLPYIDLLASCDAVITKTGYGTQTEVVANQIPTLCISREDWPEEPYLRQWHSQFGEVVFIDWALVEQGRFGAIITDLLRQPWTKAPIQPDGAQQAVTWIQRLLV